MRLTVFNGSPRGPASNSMLLTGHFLQGFESIPGNSHELFHLHSAEGRQAALKAFGSAEAVLIAFPLYVDAMPGMVMELIEGLAPYKGRTENPALLFLVQSGFPESSHIGCFVPYLEKLARRLGCDYRGTIRRGGVEGIRSQPAFFHRRLFKSLHTLGMGFGESGRLNQELLTELAGRETLPPLGLAAVGLFSKLLYWNPQLRKNGAYERRFDRPYAP